MIRLIDKDMKTMKYDYQSLLNEAPTSWEILTEDEAVSYVIKFEKSEDYLSEDDVLGRSLLNEAPTNWEILTEDEAVSYGIKFEKYHDFSM